MTVPESYGDAFAITPGTDIQHALALYVGGTGDVEVVTAAGTTTVFSGVPAGETLPIEVKQVLAGNTTATDIVGYRRR